MRIFLTLFIVLSLVGCQTSPNQNANFVDKAYDAPNDTTDITISKPLNSMQLLAAKSVDGASPFKNKKYTVTVVSRRPNSYTDLERHFIGSSHESAYALVYSLLQRCKRGSAYRACTVSHLGDRVITYSNKRELTQLIEQYVKSQNAYSNNQTSTQKREFNTVPENVSDIAILGPYKQMQFITIKSGMDKLAQKDKFRVTVVLRVVHYAGTQDRYFIGSSNISAYGLAESLLEKCRSIADDASCKVRSLGNKLINYTNEHELLRLLEIYTAKQNARASTS